MSEVARDLVHSCEKKISEAVSFEPAAGGKPVLEQLRQQVLIFRKRSHAIADIARRQGIEVAAQAAGASAIIADRDDGCDFYHRRTWFGGLPDAGWQSGWTWQPDARSCWPAEE